MERLSDKKDIANLVRIGLAAVGLFAVTSGNVKAQTVSECRFSSGFRTFHTELPNIIGGCLDNQSFDANGDAIQHTTRGLLTWRKADNRTAFTDGYQTWVNSPTGIEERLDTQRFPWEKHLPLNPQALNTPEPKTGEVSPDNILAINSIKFSQTASETDKGLIKDLLYKLSLEVPNPALFGNFAKANNYLKKEYPDINLNIVRGQLATNFADSLSHTDEFVPYGFDCENTCWIGRRRNHITRKRIIGLGYELLGFLKISKLYPNHYSKAEKKQRMIKYEGAMFKEIEAEVLNDTLNTLNIPPKVGIHEVNRDFFVENFTHFQDYSLSKKLGARPNDLAKILGYAEDNQCCKGIS